MISLSAIPSQFLFPNLHTPPIKPHKVLLAPSTLLSTYWKYRVNLTTTTISNPTTSTIFYQPPLSATTTQPKTTFFNRHTTTLSITLHLLVIKRKAYRCLITQFFNLSMQPLNQFFRKHKISNWPFKHKQTNSATSLLFRNNNRMWPLIEGRHFHKLEAIQGIQKMVRIEEAHCYQLTIFTKQGF